MSRREFSKQVKRDAFLRAEGKCEGVKADGKPCAARLTIGKYHYDHDIADGLGGEPELWNCKVSLHGLPQGENDNQGHSFNRESETHQRRAEGHQEASHHHSLASF